MRYAERMQQYTDRRNGISDRRNQIDAMRRADDRAARTLNYVLAALGGAILSTAILVLLEMLK